MSTSLFLMHQLNCHASSHVCALCHGIDCPSLFRCLFASSRIDDDVETDEVYDTTSEELAQYQATELAGKYSLT